MSVHTEQRDERRGGPRGCHRTRNRKKRPKTFSTVEAANKYATEKGIKSYLLVNLKPYSNSKKIRILVK